MKNLFSNDYLTIKTDLPAAILYWEWTYETKALTDEKFLALLLNK